jgi:toluene monooxygenase electron transfer component
MKVTVQSKSGITEFQTDSDDNLLYAGLKQGIGLPYECATGTCGTCRARIMEGDVSLAWDEAPGLAYVKRAKNEVLLCQAHTHGDCTVRVPAKVEPTDTAARPADFTGHIDTTQRLTHDVIQFEVLLNRQMCFAAGQFAAMTCEDLTGARAYSMVNHADSTDRLVFVVKRKPAGRFSDWLFETDVTGKPLKLTGPFGRATFRPEENKNFVCIAGGSGVAGMMSIAQHATRNGYLESHTGHIFFGVRTMQDCFYTAEFAEHVRHAGGNLEVTIALSNEEPPQATHPEHPEIRLAGGFVHEVAAREMAGRYDNMVGFVAGPPPMVDGALRMLIMEARLPAEFIRYDKFG